MDVLSDLLDRARAKNAVVRQLIQLPPWSFTLADSNQLSAIAALEGTATITLEDATTHTLTTGDLALIKGGEYTIADQLSTPNQVVIREGVKHVVDATGERVTRMIAPRTYGERRPGATVTLHGIYELHGSAGARLLDLLPTLTAVPASPRTRAPLELLAAEAQREEPGQDAVLHRLLEFVLVVALRSWGADTEIPTWFGAIAEPAIGEALALLHADPRRGWTTAALATEVRMSRAAFSARFTRLVGEPPMAYLTGWRMTLAADLLRDTDATVAAVAREVGYENAFAFSTAFKRVHGRSPAAWRRS